MAWMDQKWSENVIGHQKKKNKYMRKYKKCTSFKFKLCQRTTKHHRCKKEELRNKTGKARRATTLCYTVTSSKMRWFIGQTSRDKKKKKNSNGEYKTESDGRMNTLRGGDITNLGEVSNPFVTSQRTGKLFFCVHAV